MASKSKLERLRQELIEKHNNPVIIQEYDKYKRRLLEPDPGNPGKFRFIQDPCITLEVRLSDIALECRADYDNIKSMVEKGHAYILGVEVEESKKQYESPEQELWRKTLQADPEKTWPIHKSGDPYTILYAVPPSMARKIFTKRHTR